MRGPRTLLLTLIAALFAVSGVARAMPMPAAPPPCHEAPAGHDKSKPATLAVSCCAACMPAPLDAGIAVASIPLARPRFALTRTTAEGVQTTPDPRPPRFA